MIKMKNGKKYEQLEKELEELERNFDLGFVNESDYEFKSTVIKKEKAEILYKDCEEELSYITKEIKQQEMKVIEKMKKKPTKKKRTKAFQPSDIPISR